MCYSTRSESTPHWGGQFNKLKLFRIMRCSKRGLETMMQSAAFACVVEYYQTTPTDADLDAPRKILFLFECSAPFFCEDSWERAKREFIRWQAVRDFLLRSIKGASKNRIFGLNSKTSSCHLLRGNPRVDSRQLTLSPGDKVRQKNTILIFGDTISSTFKKVTTSGF